MVHSRIVAPHELWLAPKHRAHHSSGSVTGIGSLRFIRHISLLIWNQRQVPAGVQAPVAARHAVVDAVALSPDRSEDALTDVVAIVTLSSQVGARSAPAVG